MKADAKFSTAIHICLYLHFRGEKLLSSQEIAESVGTNPVVIRRLLSDLRNSDIVASVAGAHGGFHLTKAIQEINLWNIYQAVNDRDLFHRPKVNDNCPVSRNLRELIKTPFQDAEQAMRPSMEKVSISQLYGKLEGILGKSETFC